MSGDKQITMKEIFTIPVRVYYEDTDAGGVVFYANYLKFMERARTEWLRALGFEQDELMAQDGVVFAVSRVNLEYLRPARFNQQLTVSVDVVRKGAASVTLNQEIRQGDILLTRGEVRLACVDTKSFKPQKIPERILQRMIS
jgi:acyl-CoA thioester hydrolase